MKISTALLVVGLLVLAVLAATGSFTELFQ